MDDEKKKDVENGVNDVKKENRIVNNNVSETKTDKTHVDAKVEAKQPKIQPNKVDKTTVNNGVDVQKEEKDKNPKASNEKKKKIILFSSIGIVALIVVITIIALIVNGAGKPSKKQAKELIETYIDAYNDKDSDAFLDAIDTEGYIIFEKEGEKNFNKKYKEKSEYIKRFLKKNDYDEIEEYEEDLADKFERSNSNEYEFKEIKDIKKSKKSNKIVVIRAKVKMESSYSSSTSTKTMKLYVIKNKGKFKIVGAEFV